MNTARRLNASHFLSGVIASVSLTLLPSLSSANGVNSGQYTTHVPIELVTAPTGHTPEISLVYDHEGANGIVGIGWNISGIPAITRRSHGNGINYDGNDTYGGPHGRLVDISGGARTRYHSINESWADYVPSGTCGDGPCSWTVTEKDGTVYTYGGPQGSSAAIARWVNGSATASIRVWALAKVQDTHGNFYTITYVTNRSGVYPNIIQYNQGAGISKNYFIQFDYATRTDDFALYTENAWVRLPYRLSDIRVTANSGTLIRQYNLSYQYSPTSGRSELTAVQEVGADGSSTLPPTTFAYKNDQASGGAGTASSYTDQAWLHTGDGGAWVDNSTVLSGDFNGDGLQDFAYVFDNNGNLSVDVYVNNAGTNGTNTFTKARWKDATMNWTGGTNWRHFFQVYAADMDGDGKTDILIIHNSNTATSGTNSDGSTWDVTQGTCPKSATGNGNITMNVMLSNGTGFGNNNTWSGNTGPWLGGVCWQQYGAFALGDFNGDGLTDVMWIYEGGSGLSITMDFYGNVNGTSINSNFTWWNNHSSQSANSNFSCEGSCNYGNFDWGKFGTWLTGDFDGDGRTDLAYVHRDTAGGSGNILVNIFASYGKFGGPTNSCTQDAPCGFAMWNKTVGGPWRGSENGDPYPAWEWGKQQQFLAADFNGDGITDIADVYATLCTGGSNCVSTPTYKNVDMYVSTGSAGNSDGSGMNYVQSWFAATTSELWQDAAHTMAYDANGDGLTDLIFDWNNGDGNRIVTVNLSSGNGFNGGSRWAPDDPSSGTFGPAGTTLGRTSFLVPGDYNGNGVTDIGFLYKNSNGNIWIEVSTGGNGSHSDLIRQVTRPLGGTETVEYTSAARGLDLNGNPMIHPSATTCGGPGGALSSGVGYGQPCGNPLTSGTFVTSVTKTDGLGHSYTTRYNYSNPRYYPGSVSAQGNLGFQWVQTTEPSGVTRVTTYVQDHQTGYAREPAMHQVYSSDGNLMSQDVETHTVLNTTTSPALPSYDVGISKIVKLTETHSVYEMGTFMYTKEKDYSYDSYANVTEIFDRGDTATTADDKHICTNHINSELPWRIGLPYSVRVDTASGCPSPLTQNHINYDGQANGSVGAAGDVTSTCLWRDDTGTWGCERITYDSAGRPLTKANAAGGMVVTNTYDTAYGSLATTADAAGNVATYSWNDDQTAAATTDANGNATTFSYDTFGRTTQVLPSGGGKLTTSYFTDASHCTVNGMIALGCTKHTLQLDSSSTRTAWTYVDGLSRTIADTVTGDNGVLTRLVHLDSFGREYMHCAAFYSQEDSATCSQTYYDTAQRVVKVTSPKFGGGTVNETATYSGYTSTHTDAGGNVTTSTYDPAMLTHTMTDALGQVTSRKVDILHRTTAITDPQGNKETITYDSLGLKLSDAHPATGTTTYTYDDAGKLLSTTDAAATTVKYSYDAAERLISIDRAPFGNNGPEDTLYKYDYLSSKGDVPNGAGRLVQLTYPNGLTATANETYSYNAQGLRAIENMTIDGQTFTTSKLYNFAELPTSITFPNGQTETIAYNSAGNVVSIAYGGTNLLGYSNFENSGNLTGRPQTIALNGGTADTETRAYDEGTGLISNDSDVNGFVNKAYSYGARRGLTLVADNRASKPNGDVTTAYSVDADFRLVAAARGPGATCSAGTCAAGPGGWNKSYAYDAAGRLTSKDGKTFTYNTSGRPFQLLTMTGETTNRTYDAAGRLLVKSGGWTYAYDADGNLVQVQQNGVIVAQYVYDSAGQRVKTTIPGVSTTWSIGAYEVYHQASSGTYLHTVYINGPHETGSHITSQSSSFLALAPVHHSHVGMLASLGQLGVLILVMVLALGSCMIVFDRRLVWTKTRRPIFTSSPSLRGRFAPLPFTMVILLVADCDDTDHLGLHDESHDITTLNGAPQAGTFFYLKTPQGSTNQLMDQNGRSILTLEYDPYGATDPNASQGNYVNSTMYTGQIYDSSSGIYYYNARYYDPQTGQFLTPDDNNIYGRGHLALNAYAYGADDPADHTDPSGHMPLLAGGGGGDGGGESESFEGGTVVGSYSYSVTTTTRYVPYFTYSPSTSIPMIRPTGLRSILMTHVQVWESIDASVKRHVATLADATRSTRVRILNAWIGPSGVHGQHVTMRGQSTSYGFLGSRDAAIDIVSLLGSTVTQIAGKAYLHHVAQEVTETGTLTIRSADEGSKLGRLAIELSGAHVFGHLRKFAASGDGTIEEVRTAAKLRFSGLSKLGGIRLAGNTFFFLTSLIPTTSNCHHTSCHIVNGAARITSDAGNVWLAVDAIAALNEEDPVGWALDFVIGGYKLWSFARANPGPSGKFTVEPRGLGGVGPGGAR